MIDKDMTLLRSSITFKIEEENTSLKEYNITVKQIDEYRVNINGSFEFVKNISVYEKPVDQEYYDKSVGFAKEYLKYLMNKKYSDNNQKD